MPYPARDIHQALNDFLAWEHDQPERWEFIDGEARMMTGGTQAHALVTANVSAALKGALKGRPCRVYSPDLKVITAHADVFYPDVSVSCGPSDLKGTWQEDPILVAEVLSPSSLADDYGRKRLSYQSIPSLRHYLIVAQDRAQVELYSRQGNGWLAQSFEGVDAMVRLEALEVELSLADLYDGAVTDQAS